MPQKICYYTKIFRMVFLKIYNLCIQFIQCLMNYLIQLDSWREMWIMKRISFSLAWLKFWRWLFVHHIIARLLKYLRVDKKCIDNALTAKELELALQETRDGNSCGNRLDSIYSLSIVYELIDSKFINRILNS